MLSFVYVSRLCVLLYTLTGAACREVTLRNMRRGIFGGRRGSWGAMCLGD